MVWLISVNQLFEGEREKKEKNAISRENIEMLVNKDREWVIVVEHQVS